MKPILQIVEVSKSYGGIQALDSVSFDVLPGTIHAITGENGAGKSTLMKIVAGLETPDSGQLQFHGGAIAMIQQELSPFSHLSVAENIFMGREPTRWIGGWIDKAERNRRAKHLLAQLGMDLDPNRRVGDLPLAEQQSVEIAKALARSADVLIMDEPTSAFSEHESELLYRIVLDLKNRGVATLYISHRMQEIFALADTITVMRDGRRVTTRPATEFDEDLLIRLMVGRTPDACREKSDVIPGAVVLEVKELARRPRFHGVNFTLRAGEILGLAGLMGSGRTEVATAIFGLAPASDGEIFVRGQRVRIQSPDAALALGITMVTEDRKRFGFIPEMSIQENVTLSSLSRFCAGPFLRRSAEASAADEQIRKFDVRAAGRRQPVKSLSGGNQQKVVLARALLNDPDIVILDEPTRGIDVAAKSEIYALIADLARQGKAILLISSEMSEVLALSDRILVMREGTPAGQLLPRSTSPEEILRYAVPN
jgi:inositol transport system ATP-binding protein